MYWALWTLLALSALDVVFKPFQAVKQRNNSLMVAAIIETVITVFALFELVRI